MAPSIYLYFLSRKISLYNHHRSVEVKMNILDISKYFY